MSEITYVEKVNHRKHWIAGGLCLLTLPVWYWVWVLVAFEALEGPNNIWGMPIADKLFIALLFYPLLAVGGTIYSIASAYTSRKLSLLVSFMGTGAIIMGIIFLISLVSNS